MASNVIIPTTQVADTGTGATMEPFRLLGDRAIFREASPVGPAALLVFNGTEPKVTKDFAGMQRGEVRFTRQVADTAGKLWPNTFTVNSSLPAFQTDAQRAAFIKEAVMALSLAVSQDVLSKQTIPQ